MLTQNLISDLSCSTNWVSISVAQTLTNNQGKRFHKDWYGFMVVLFVLYSCVALVNKGIECFFGYGPYKETR